MPLKLTGKLTKDEIQQSFSRPVWQWVWVPGKQVTDKGILSVILCPGGFKVWKMQLIVPLQYQEYQNKNSKRFSLSCLMK